MELEFSTFSLVSLLSSKDLKSVLGPTLLFQGIITRKFIVSLLDSSVNVRAKISNLWVVKSFTKSSGSNWPKCTSMLIRFWDFLMFYQTFLSPQVKRNAIISNKHDIFAFAPTLPFLEDTFCPPVSSWNLPFWDDPGLNVRSLSIF